MVQHTIVYIGMRKISARRYVHIGFDVETKTIVPMPKELIPREPEPVHP